MKTRGWIPGGPFLLLIFVFAGVSACSEAPPASGDGASMLDVSDSVGIRVASFDRQRLPLVARAGDEPEWIIGEGGEAGLNPALHGVTSVVALPDGRIALAEGSTQEVLFVDLEERTVERAGGAGDGPEEFRGLSALHVTEEGVVRAVDQRRLRIVDMQWGGEFVGEASLPDLLGGGAGGRILIDGAGSVYIARLSGVLAPGDERIERPVGALVRAGESTDTLATLRGREVFSNEHGMGTVIWGATTEVAPGPAGVWVGDTGTSYVELWREPGQVSAIVRWSDVSDRTLTDADVEAFLNRLEEAAGPSAPGQIQALRSMLPFAQERPYFGPIVAGRDGSLWIGSPRDPGFDAFEGAIEGLEPATEWMVVHLEEGTAGRAITPEGFRLTDVGEGYVIGIHRDALGRESVRRHPMERVQDTLAGAGRTD